MTPRQAYSAARNACFALAALATLSAASAWAVGNPAGGQIIGTVAALSIARLCGRRIRALDDQAARDRAFVRLHATDDFQAFQQAFAELAENITAALTPPLRALAQAFADMEPAFARMADALRPVIRASFPAGTVQHPADPSPLPRGVFRDSDLFPQPRRPRP